MRNPFPIVLVVWQFVGDGAGCGSGVIGSPWWNVDVP
jgi:hypothetical protein